MQDFLDKKHTALIIVDVQNDFCHEKGAFSEMGLRLDRVYESVYNIELLIRKAKSLNIPIIFTKMTNDANTMSETWKNKPKRVDNPVPACSKGSWGAEFYQLNPSADDIVIEKHRYSSFVGTNLDTILRSLNIKSLLVSGFASNICVESTLRDGFQLDYHATMINDASSTYSEELHQSTISNIETNFGLALDTREILNFWD